jgi:hypothetical protein
MDRIDQLKGKKPAATIDAEYLQDLFDTIWAKLCVAGHVKCRVQG